MAQQSPFWGKTLRGWPVKSTEQSDLLPNKDNIPLSATIIQPALVWGATFGFGWAVVRQALTGRLLWLEILVVSILFVIICAGILYLKRG